MEEGDPVEKIETVPNFTPEEATGYVNVCRC